MPDFDDDRGVGLVLVNTAAGKEAFAALDMEVRQSTLEDARRCNGGFKEAVAKHPKREMFFHSFARDTSVAQAVDVVLYIPRYRSAFRKAKNVAVKIFKRLLR